MVNKKRAEIVVEGGQNTMEEIQNELPKILEGHEETAQAIQRCVDVCGPFRNKKFKKKRVSKVSDLEKPEEEVAAEVKPVDPIEEKKKELLREMSTIGMGQVAKIRKLLKRIEELNEATFKANLAAPMARHELMTLLAEQGIRLPLWVSPVGEHPPPLVGAIGANDAYKLNVGDYCAAFCEDLWILGEVRGIAENGRYEIKDVDDNEKSMTILARRRVIPLPRYRADPERDNHAVFPKNAWILALYPQTTVFYKGIVDEPPKRATDPYKVSFDDSTFNSGFSPALEVPQRYVLAFREVAYKPREKSEGREKCKVKELTKEEIKEQKELEREKKRHEKEEQKKLEKLRRKEEKKAEKERIKKEKKEEKQKEKERKKKEKKKEKNRLARERRLKKKLEEKEKKETEDKETSTKDVEGEKDESDRREDNNEEEEDENEGDEHVEDEEEEEEEEDVENENEEEEDAISDSSEEEI
ncbi:hypothetical protein PRIPAC_95339 [Pristionchus pacificus]|uniref:SGF29 C-terminal domain-containing protein n=1 Tax=Pristionchus pacificus TaxID=54126 RepID=A0A2A6B2M4_PRIPA|nr:hypothetical protein PRIPAC_95339 [Pristionchus pacificus]|eukprot:PDM60126.1 hypothetical protein PRIPAC_49412 [Pristionchus pacificus]